MPFDQRVENLRRWWLAMNRKDLAELDQLAGEIYTPDFIVHDPDMPGVEPGRAALKTWVREMFARNPDAHLDVDDIFVDGNYIITRATATGNDPASGKPIHLVMLAVDRFVGEQIAEVWEIVKPGKW